MPEKWTNRSRPPSSGVMKPKPLSSENHLTVPDAITSSSPLLAGLFRPIDDRPDRPVPTLTTLSAYLRRAQGSRYQTIGQYYSVSSAAAAAIAARSPGSGSHGSRSGSPS